MKVIKTKREKKFTPKPAREVEVAPLDETLAMLWSAKKKSPKK